MRAVSRFNDDADFDESNIQDAVVRDWFQTLSTPIPIRRDKDLLVRAHSSVAAQHTSFALFDIVHFLIACDSGVRYSIGGITITALVAPEGVFLDAISNP